jgi:ribonuclease T1
VSRRTRAVAGVVVLAVLLLAFGLARSDLLGVGPAPTHSAGPAIASRTIAGQTTAGPTRPGRDPESGLPFVELGGLPAEARLTVQRIDSGGPFPYPKDGVVFGNRERLLPAQTAGYYREYTVPTPGSGDRGARRIVTGDRNRQLFYTGDHYLTFARIRR